MLLLAFSSIMFAVPTIIGMRKKKRRAALATGVLTVSSILFHGIGHKWMQIADIGLAHALVACYTVKGAAMYIRKPSPVLLVGCLNSVTACAMYAVNNTVARSDIHHVFVQINGNIAMLCYLMGS